MRHRKNFNHLGRKAGHRKAMLANMASSLILHKRIKTTTAKAKALRMYIEPLITKTKDLDSITEKTHAQRVVFSYLQDKHAVNELFVEVAPKVESRPGGYTRIIKLGNRLGDNADMCIIELVDFNETMLAAKEESQAGAGKKRRRRGSSGSKAKQTEESTPQVKEEAKADVAEEVVEEEAKEEAETVEQVNVEAEAEEEVVEEEVKEETSEETGINAEASDESGAEEQKDDGEESKDTESDKKEE